MTTRTSAEIEAGARALHENSWALFKPEERGPSFDDDTEHNKEFFRVRARLALAAADAAAAPAVGVTVDEDVNPWVNDPRCSYRASAVSFAGIIGDERVTVYPSWNWYAIETESGDDFIGVELDRAQMQALRDHLTALLTTQPEKGTDDDRTR